ncbi:MAG: sodium/proton-translocating pyrophosphatase, partial [Acidobacteriota bacterium]|nr:sodium/proton-translocating pyrophosphatase [Acidobacteriota bacterium]
MLYSISGISLLLLGLKSKRVLTALNQNSFALWARRSAYALFGIVGLLAFSATPAWAATTEAGGGEAALKLPDLSDVTFFGGMNGRSLLLIGLVVCFLGLLFGLAIYMNLKKLPVHRAMREISELIYATCKTYLTTQGKFILLLWVFIAAIIVLYFGVLAPVPGKPLTVTLPIIVAFSLIGIAGSYG